MRGGTCAALLSCVLLCGCRQESAEQPSPPDAGAEEEIVVVPAGEVEEPESLDEPAPIEEVEFEEPDIAPLEPGLLAAPAEVPLMQDGPAGDLLVRAGSGWGGASAGGPRRMVARYGGSTISATGRAGKQQQQQPVGVQTWQRSQLVPNTSRLKVGEKEELPLKKMQVDVRVDGFRARVLLDCYFLNDRSQRLEGTFQLRLPDGASPYFFAFGQTVYKAPGDSPDDPFDQARAEVGRAGTEPAAILAARSPGWEQPKVARIVPKEKAALAYRQTVRRRVDPALVEWSGAGVFNCRVFPLAPQKLHRIVIGYDVDLLQVENDLEFRLDLPAKRPDCVVDLSVAEGAGRGVTVNPAVEMSTSAGRLHYHLVNPKQRTISVRIHDAATVMLVGSDPKSGPYFATRFQPALRVDRRSGGSPYAVFLVDVSLSSRPEKFNVWLKLLEAILENNRDRVEQFAVLFFNVEAFWWQDGFVANTRGNVEAVLKFADTLVLEGATDVGRALSEAASPGWLAPAGPGDTSDLARALWATNLSGWQDEPGEVPRWDLFLLSDGAATWGEHDPYAVSHVLESSGSGPVFAYTTGFSGSDGRLLEHLTRESGGAVFSVVGEQEIAKASTAHRCRPWQLVGIELAGGEDLLLAGRPKFIFPKQQLLLAGRGTPDPNNAEIVLTLKRGKTQKTIHTKLERVVQSELAPRAYGQVAVGQLEDLAEATEEAAVAYARHFRVPGRTCSLLMLDSEQDYQRFNIKPEEDAFVVNGSPASLIMANALDSLGKSLGDPKGRFFARLAKLEKMPGVRFRLSTALRTALESMPPSSFAVAVPPLSCRARTRDKTGGDTPERLPAGEPDYDAIVAEARRRREAYGPDDAVRVLSSLVEGRPGDVALIRDVAFSAMEWQRGGQAYHLLRRAAAARPYEPQSYHAIARCLEELGQTDLALAYYEVAFEGGWDRRFGDFRTILVLDYLHFLRRIAQGRIETTMDDFARARLETVANQHQLPKAHLVVTITWNTDGTDVDLHVTEPSGEECYYEHHSTRIGGQLTRDVTEGYGPETYALRKAVPGSYKIRAHYYASDANRTSTRTKVYATIYEARGTEERKVTRNTVTLAQVSEMQDLATIVVEPTSADRPRPPRKPVR